MQQVDLFNNVSEPVVAFENPWKAQQEAIAAMTAQERLETRGAKSLSDSELMSLVFPGDNEAQRVALCEHGGLTALFDHATNKDIVGAFKELSCRWLEGQLQKKDALTDATQAGKYLIARLRHRKTECFSALFLDNRHRVLAFEELFEGTIDGAAVYPRVVAKRALELNAAALILSHNHPSGVPEPSPADRHITKALVKALGMLEIRVLDHLVIGDGEWVSLAQRGMM